MWILTMFSECAKAMELGLLTKIKKALTCLSEEARLSKGRTRRAFETGQIELSVIGPDARRRRFGEFGHRRKRVS
jgi:hypothetical protein